METLVAPPVENRSAPLLPRVLLAPASFLWLWVLPLAILGLLNLQGYWLIGSEMTPEQRGRALGLGVTGAANLLAGLAAFGVVRFARGRVAESDHPLWGLPGLLCQVAYLWLAIASLNAGLVPRNVGAWIYSDGRFVFNQFAFCMLPAFHGVLRLAAARSPAANGRTLAVSVAAAVGAPVLLYLLFASAARFGPRSEFSWAPYFVATLVIVAGVVMLVGVLRGLLVALRGAQKWHATAERWAVVLIALVLPLGGLALNRTIPFPVDFQATEVYVLTVANALVLLFAVWTGGARPWLSWLLLCATFPFSLYFFVVFLPYTPLSVLAVIAMGLGMLVLTPILLFALHLHLLRRAWTQARECAPSARLLAGGALAVLLLPGFFTARNLADKAALNAALDHLHQPKVAAGKIEFRSSLTNLRRAVNSHRGYKEGLYYPLLSDYYAWLVLDNLVLPDAELDEIKNVFFGSRRADDSLDPFRQPKGAFDRGRASNVRRLRRVAPPPQTVVVENLVAKTAAVEAGSTLVTLSLKLRNAGRAPAEYESAFGLPSGVLVRGFRLQVGDALVPGRIFERKTALWVYAMIRDWERRDPGILFYRDATELELRVFPVAADKPTTVEIDLLVPTRVTAGQLAEADPTPAAVLARLASQFRPVVCRDDQGARVVAGVVGGSLPTVVRPPYLHVIVDRSRDDGFVGNLADISPALRARFPEARRVRFSVANYEVAALVSDLVPIDRLPEVGPRELERAMPLSGGLALDLALAHAIRSHRDRDLDGALDAGAAPARPIFVILSRHAHSRARELPLTEAWADLVPGLEVCELGADGSFVTHRRDAGAVAPLLRCGNSVRPLTGRRWVRFAAGQDGALSCWDAAAAKWRRLPGDFSETPDSAWTEAMRLHLAQQSYDRSPGDSAISRRTLVEASRRSGVLLASTSFIVVENRAQWRMLEKSERQKLGQNQALDFVETPAPPEVWIVAGFAGWLLWRRWWRRKQPAPAA